MGWNFAKLVLGEGTFAFTVVAIIGWVLVGLLAALVGLVMYLRWKAKRNDKRLSRWRAQVVWESGRGHAVSGADRRPRLPRWMLP